MVSRNIPEENCDFRNNVIYNWGHNNVYAGEGGNYNIVNNYYKWGPDTKDNVKTRIVNPYNKLPSISFGKYYVDGNYVEDAHEVTTNNWQGVILEKGTASDMLAVKQEKPFTIVELPTQSAKEAYELVLKSAGAILPKRDTLDERINYQCKKGNREIY